MSESSSDKISEIISEISRIYGADEWWEADSAEEVMIGAILTQQTRWENVRTAISRLKMHGLCSFPKIRSADPAFIEELIRPTGYYRQKTRRLKLLAEFVLERHGGMENLSNMETHLLRRELLSVNGVGEETADSILAYGFMRDCIVIDRYTKRIFACAGITSDGDELRRAFGEALPGTSSAKRGIHGHLVEYAKDFCNKSRCEECVIRNLCE
ncbi:MAG TPA: Fe-S cluster assembly protein HesB [Methanoregulaceae archaeon]|nr:Fe-S cluster assembly protein HesB [Methanoregulaceae archaeon]